MNKIFAGLLFAFIPLIFVPVSANILNMFSQPSRKPAKDVLSVSVRENNTQPRAYRSTRFGDTPHEANILLYRDLGKYTDFNVRDLIGSELQNGEIVGRINRAPLALNQYEFSVTKVLEDALRELNLVDPDKFNFSDFERYLSGGMPPITWSNFEEERYYSADLNEFLAPYFRGTVKAGPRVLFSTDHESYNFLETPFGRIELVFSVNRLTYSATVGRHPFSLEEAESPSYKIWNDYPLLARGEEWFESYNYDKQQERQGLLMVYVSFWRRIGVVTPTQVVKGFTEKYPEGIIDTEEMVFDVKLPVYLPIINKKAPQRNASARLDIVTIRHLHEGRFVYLKNYDLDSFKFSLGFDYTDLKQRYPSVTIEQFEALTQELSRPLRSTFEDPRMSKGTSPINPRKSVRASFRHSDLFHMPYIIYLGTDLLEGIVDEYRSFRQLQERETGAAKDSQAEGALEF